MTQTLSQIPPETPGENVRGFLPDHEGQQLFEWANQAAPVGPLLEIGSYCGRSTLWLGQAAKAHDTVVFALDHHRGSEEHQPGESHHDEALIDTTGQFDSFGEFRRNIAAADLEDTVIPIVASSEMVGPYWQSGLGMVFIDGGHSLDAALTDYRAWAPHVLPGGILAIHDVFPDPADGGQAPFTIWQLATQSGLFEPLDPQDTLRGLRRLGRQRAPS
jgi:predicted O-methyltransferase YrrM